MVLLKPCVNKIRDELFKSELYNNSTLTGRQKLSKVLFQFAKRISMLTGGGLTVECALDSLLVVVAWCSGPSNLRIHGNYEKAIQKFKCIVAPISALKSPQYRFIQKLLQHLGKVLESAYASLSNSSSDSQESDSEIIDDSKCGDTKPLLEPGTFEGLELDIQNKFQNCGVILSDEGTILLSNLGKTSK